MSDDNAPKKAKKPKGYYGKEQKAERHAKWMLGAPARERRKLERRIRIRKRKAIEQMVEGMVRSADIVVAKVQSHVDRQRQANVIEAPAPSTKTGKRNATKRVVPLVERVTNLVRERERTGGTSATPERLVKAGEDGFETTPPSREAPNGIQRVNQAPLDRLHAIGGITEREYQAGDKFRGDAYLAGLDPGAPTVDWGRAGGAHNGSRAPSMFSSQMIADARLRHRRTENSLPGLVFSVAHNALIHEHTLIQIGEGLFARKHPREAAGAGHAAFRMALAVLAGVYGM